MAEYLRLLPTLLYVVGVYGLVFAVVATVVKRGRGHRGVWVVWAVYLALVTGSCIIGLSRIAMPDTGSAARFVYYAVVALASVGFPLWCAARALLVLAARNPAVREHWQVAGAWFASIVTAPVGLLLMFGVDRVAAALQWSPFTS